MPQFKMIRCTMSGAEAVVARSHRAFARHTHDRFGLGLIEQGGHRSHSGRGQVEAGPGDAITVNPGEVHDGAPLNGAGRAWRMLYLDPAIVAQAAHDISVGRTSGFEFSRPVVHDKSAGRLVRSLFRAATSGVAAIRHEELLLAALTAFGRESEPWTAPRAPAEIARARALIDDDPAAPHTLAELAEASSLSRFQVLRGFARATGLTPHAYVVQRRIDLVRRRIAAGMALADAAAASGFADQSHMTRTFVCRYGITPRAYADAVR